MRNISVLAHGLSLFTLTTLTLAKVDHSLVYSGKYEIRKCNARDLDSMASKLQALLPMIWSNLQTTIVDTQKGTASQHGYSAFFKTNDSIGAVQKVYQDIADGSPVDRTNSAITSPGRNINPTNLVSPGLVCVQDGDPVSLAAYRSCTMTQGPGGTGMIAAVGAQYILLCPFFFTLPLLPSPAACPRTRRNTLTPNNDRLVLNQASQLVHELAHLQGIGGGGGSNGLSWRMGQYEPVFLREAVALGAGDAVNNAQNFAYYFAANVAGCTDWPKDIVHEDGRRLLGLERPLNVSLADPASPGAGDPVATRVVEFLETDVPAL